MTKDGGGWTLIARSTLGDASDKTTVGAYGTLTSPSQGSTAKLADSVINSIAFTHMMFRINDSCVGSNPNPTR